MKYLIAIISVFICGQIFAATVTKSIGTDGKDYATITLFEDAINNTTYSSANTDVVGEMYDDSVFDESVTFNQTDTNIDSITLSVASGERHDGTFGTGARIVATANRSILVVGINNVTFEWLEFDWNGNTGPEGIGQNSGQQNLNLTIANILGHGAVRSGNHWMVSLGQPTTSDDADGARLINSILYDAVNTATNSTVVYGVNTGPNATSRPTKVLNCTFHNIVNNNGSGNAGGVFLSGDSSGKEIRNTICTDTGGTSSGTLSDFVGTALSSGTESHNLASDTTASGTGSLDSKTAANQFVSIAGGSEDLHLKTGADAIDVGVDLVTTPTGVNFDIDNRDRDAEGDTWDMGAHEFVAAAPSGIVVLRRRIEQ